MNEPHEDEWAWWPAGEIVDLLRGLGIVKDYMTHLEFGQELSSFIIENYDTILTTTKVAREKIGTGTPEDERDYWFAFYNVALCMWCEAQLHIKLPPSEELLQVVALLAFAHIDEDDKYEIEFKTWLKMTNKGPVEGQDYGMEGEVS